MELAPASEIAWYDTSKPIWQILDALAEPITIILVIIGWVVVHRQQAYSHRRQEVRQMLEHAHETIERIDTQAEKYWFFKELSIAERRRAARSIIRHLKILHGRIKIIAHCCKQSYPIDAIKEYRKSITGYDFETAEAEHLTDDSERVHDMRQCRADLFDSIEAMFLAKFS